MDRPKIFAGLRLKPDSTHAPFAQPSPPPRRHPAHRSASHQAQRPSRPSASQLASSSVRKPPPQPPQWVQQQQLKKRKPRPPKHEEAAVLPTTTTNPKVRSRIPFQWRLPTHAPSASGSGASQPSLAAAHHPDQPGHSPDGPTPRKPSHKPSFIFRSLVRSHSISSGSPSAVSSPAHNPDHHRTSSNHSHSIPSRSTSASLEPLAAYDSIHTQPRPARPPSPRAGSSISSSSSSFHPSINHLTDSEPESLCDDHEEVLSSHSHVTRPAETPVPTPSSDPPIPNSSTRNLASVSRSSLPEASHRLTTNSPRPPHCPLPPSPSPSDSSPHQSSSELPFACPSPTMPRQCPPKRHARPHPAQAPPLPCSRPPSLVIRPKFSSSTNKLDWTTNNTSSSQRSSNVHPRNSASDHDHRPLSGPKSDMMRGLGWGRAPIDPPRLISPSPSLAHNFSSSELSINRPDAIITDYLLASRSSNGQPQPNQSPSAQVTPLHSRAKTFKDRFTLAGTAPLRLSKREHARHQSTTSAAGRRIASSLFAALTPASKRHTVMDPGDEKRKVEFKRLISYPVLNHSTSGDEEPSHDEHRSYQSEPEPDCYNLSIEAAMRSLEGTHPNLTTPMRTPRPSSKSSSNEQEDRPISWTFEDKPDLSDVDAQEYSFSSERSDAWRQKLNLFMMKSKNRQASSPSPVARSRGSPDSGLRLAQKQLRSKASARLRPLIRRVSSVSLRQRGWIGERETGTAFEAHQLGRTGEEIEEEELLALGRTPVKRSNPERAIKLKSDSRLRQIHSSLYRGHTPRSASSPSVGPNTPQQGKPPLSSSQSIREKRKIFEPPLSPSTRRLPRSAISSSAGSITSSSHSMSMGASASSGVDQLSSVPSERRYSKRKPTPTEIKLRDETQSVKALVDKFETQHHHNSLGRSIDSDSLKKRARGSLKTGRTISTGVIRTSLLSLWSGDRSSSGSRRVASRRVSRQLILEQRRKTSGRSTHSSKTSEGASEGDARQTWKLKKKAKKIFHNDNSSSSSFGCTFNEADEYTYDLGDPHVDLSLPVKLPGSPDLSNNHHLSMVLPKSASIQQKRSTWSVGNSSPRAPGENKLKAPGDLNLQAFTSRFACSGLSGSNRISAETEHHDAVDSESSNQLRQKPSFDCAESSQDRACSPLSSEQAHQAQTVLEPQTVWMGDGSQRQILVTGGSLQVAKKIPFPSFEDDADFSQNVNLPPSTEPPTPSIVTRPAEQPTQTRNRADTFLMTRKFDDVLLDEDEGDRVSPRGRPTISLKQNREEGGMLSPAGIASLEDSPTLGRSRWRQSMLLSCLDSSPSASPGGPHSAPHLFLAPASDVDEKDGTPQSSPSSQEIQRMYLGVDRCEGLGNKMFGSTISNTQHDRDSPVGRRAASVIIISSTARLFPLSPTGSCPSPSSSHRRPQSPRSPARENIPLRHSQSSSPPCIRSTRSSLLKYERIDQPQGDDHTEMTDPIDFGEETPQKHQPALAQRRASSAVIKTPTNNTSKLYREGRHPDDFGMGAIDEVANKALRHEIARLERVKERWLQLCREVEDVLRKSRERWPDQDKSAKVLQEFVNPATRSSIHTFLERSRRLYKETSGQPFTANHVGQERDHDDLTPPPRHPFGRLSVVPVSAGSSCQRTRGRDGVNTREFSITPSKPRGASKKSQAQGGIPLLITLPVPSAFVSPERFRGSAKAPKSEQGPRVKKVSHTSWRSGPRQPTLSNRLGSPSVKLVTARNYQRERMMSGTSIGNVSITSSNGKVILGERSVNQLPSRMDQDQAQTSGDKKPASFSPKLLGRHGGTSSSKTVGNLSRAAGRPSIAKWELENEGSLFMSAAVRETRKPWRRSILAREILPREPCVSLVGSATGSADSAAEEVGVLVAAGEQPREFSSTFHVSGSLRLKHRRRPNHIRHD